MAKNKRKTIEVGTLLYRVNYFLKNGCDTTPDEREVMCTFIEGVLHDTGNYMGYAYLSTDEIEGNGSRRHYFVSSKIDEDYEAAKALVEKHYYGRGV
jgi:hypothetical protein